MMMLAVSAVVAATEGRREGRVSEPDEHRSRPSQRRVLICTRQPSFWCLGLDPEITKKWTSLTLCCVSALTVSLWFSLSSCPSIWRFDVIGGKMDDTYPASRKMTKVTVPQISSKNKDGILGSFVVGQKRGERSGKWTLEGRYASEHMLPGNVKSQQTGGIV